MNKTYRILDNHMAIRIEPAQFPKDTSTIYNLFCEYVASLGIDLT